ncbi:type II secretion system protein E [Sulfitobacter alexandrii]|uniref:Type II secretion system protein E n=1 Tax=Sulfitobacter alexandrii TaxID=1917485 RepID=A0A1J0WCV4_9RHOB|nr:CpaF family protein [Sulfitobacter alexandrii]APE42016.1 type II secretion system protein E [Sulfitobacter alexandrii]
MFRSFNANRPAAPAPAPARPAAQPQPSPQPAAKARPAPVAESDNGLKVELHTLLLDQLNLTVLDKVSKEDLRREIATLAAQHLQERGQHIPSGAFQALMDELLDEVLGLGPLEPLLADPTVSDILVNGTDKVFVERRGLLERTEVRFRDERHLLRIIDKIVSSVGRRIDESQPWVDARLEDGSRVNAIIRPCAIDGPSLSIRKFSRTPLHMDRLLEHGALSKPAAQFLEAAVKGRMNILISGGTGSGKTTMLNALSAFIDPRHRMVTIEDAAELQLQQEHVVRLETRPANAEGTGRITQRDLLINALRMRPDRIMVGEVRGNEAFDMLQAMNTGHDGSMTTIHANTARDAISRLEQMVTMIGGDFPMQAIRSQIAAGLQLVLQLNRLSDGRRKVTSISEIVGLEGDTVMMQDIFVFKKMGVDDDGNVKGRMMATGVRPRCFEALMSSGVSLASDAFSMMEEVA